MNLSNKPIAIIFTCKFAMMKTLAPQITELQQLFQFHVYQPLILEKVA